jgi:hypothetical protein
MESGDVPWKGREKRVTAVGCAASSGRGAEEMNNQAITLMGLAWMIRSHSTKATSSSYN